MTRAHELAARIMPYCQWLHDGTEWHLKPEAEAAIEAALRAERYAALEQAAQIVDRLIEGRDYGQGANGRWTAYVQSRRDAVSDLRALMDKPSGETEVPSLDPERKITREEMVEMFGGTFHDFDTWLATRPNLKDAGTARQLDEYARDRKPPDPTRAPDPENAEQQKLVRDIVAPDYDHSMATLRYQIKADTMVSRILTALRDTATKTLTDE